MSDDSGFRAQALGRIGENELRRLAEDAELIAIRADPDLMGWDFVVEEREPASQDPVDRRPAALRCMVQVKAVSRSGTSRGITLTNWERMAKDVRPWFVLVVHVEDRKPTSSHLVHVGKFWIERALERLTQEAARGAAKNLNKTMQIKWRDEDRIQPCDGATFAAALRRHVGSNPSAYATEKQQILDTAGYEGEPIRGSARVTFDDIDHLAAFAVGERPQLPLEDVTIDRVRFGVAIREIENGSGVLTHESTALGQPARLSVVRENTGTRCTLEVHGAIASDAFPHAVPLERDRAVLRHPVVQFSIDNTLRRVSVTYRLPEGLDTAVPIRDIGPASEFIAILAEATRDLRVDIQRDGRPPLLGELRSTARHTKELARLAVPIANAWAVARRLGLDDALVVPRALVAERKRLFVARAALESWPRMSAVVRVLAMAEQQEGQTAAVGSVAFAFGDTVCALGVSYTGRGRLDTDAEGRRVIAIENSILRAHGLRTIPAQEFRERTPEIEREIRELTIAEVEAAGAVNLFLPHSPEAPSSVHEPVSERSVGSPVS